MAAFRVDKQEFVTIETEKGQYIVINENRIVHISGNKVKVESSLPKDITEIFNLMSGICPKKKTEPAKVKQLRKPAHLAKPQKKSESQPKAEAVARKGAEKVAVKSKLGPKKNQPEPVKTTARKRVKKPARAQLEIESTADFVKPVPGKEPRKEI